MIFWASAYIHQPAGYTVNKISHCVEPFLNSAFAASSLATLKCKLRYVPIIMPKNSLELHPERSKLNKKQRIYDCSPQLNYEIFIKGSYEDQLQEYLRGIALSGPHLAGLGATKEQTADFEQIMESALECLLADQPFVKYHAWNPEDAPKEKKKLNAAQKRALKAADLQLFVKQYGRKAQKGKEPNDRRFSERTEKALRHIKPDELDKLLREDNDEK